MMRSVTARMMRSFRGCRIDETESGTALYVLRRAGATRTSLGRMNSSSEASPTGSSRSNSVPAVLSLWRRVSELASLRGAASMVKRKGSGAQPSHSSLFHSDFRKSDELSAVPGLATAAPSLQVVAGRCAAAPDALARAAPHGTHRRHAFARVPR